jgi:phenylalanyl-tRNA synthetase alpha chain
MKVQDIKKSLKDQLASLNKGIKEVKNFEDLKQLKSQYLNKNEKVLEIRKSFYSLEPKDKKSFGEELKKYTDSIISIIDKANIDLELKQQSESIADIKTDFLNINIIEHNNGTIHPLTIVADSIKNTLSKLGYSYISPEEITSTKLNFDNLNIEKEHPSRDKSDTFYINDKLILRPHCTNMTAKTIKENNDDQIKAFTIGKTYRNDTDDATHSHQFQQVDLFNISKNGTASISNLK